MKHETSTVISAPCDTVWQAMADVRRWPDWTDSVSSVEVLDEGPFRVGSQARVKQPGFPAAVWEVTDLQPGRGFTWENRSPGMTSVGKHYVQPAQGGGTVATLPITQTGALSLLARAFANKTRRYVDMEAAGLRAVSEAAAARSSDPGAVR